jgi:type IV fimbrial biogenesis protein FimU
VNWRKYSMHHPPVVLSLAPVIPRQATPTLISASISLTFIVELTMSGPVISRGFTLIELMIVLALLAIVSFIAVPNFMDFIERNRIQTQAQELQAFLLYARGEAVSRNTSITVALDEDDDDSWVAKRSSGEVIRQLTQSPELVQIDSSVDEVRFRSNGTATAASFVVCKDGDTERGFTLQIQPSGAIKLSQAGKNADGNNLNSCTL